MNTTKHHKGLEEIVKKHIMPNEKIINLAKKKEKLKCDFCEKEKSKHAHKRTKGTQGRNTLTKTPIVGLAQRGGKVKANVVENVKMRTLEQQIVSNVKIGSDIYTDEFLSYSKIGKLYPHGS